MPKMYTIGSFNTELEIALEEYRKAFGDTPGARVLAQATEADDAYGKKKYSDEEKSEKLAEAEQWARWQPKVDEEELERLLGVVATVSESSYENGYVLAKVLLGAVTGNAGINLRLNAALICGNSSMRNGKREAARSAFVDAIETIRLSDRYLQNIFRIDTQQLADAESQILSVWQSQEEPVSTPLDLSQTTAARTLIDSALWNTDKFSGFTTWVDAAIRMVIRLEHWLEFQSGDPQAIAVAFEEYIKSESLLKHRHLKNESLNSARAVTMAMCADALMETGHAGASLRLYDQALQYFDKGDLMRARISISSAAAHHFSGDTTRARQILSEIDFKNLKKLAELILTLQGELARYISVSKLLDLPSEDEQEPTELMQRIASLLVGSAEGRLGYLRNTYVGKMLHEIESFTEWNSAT